MIHSIARLGLLGTVALAVLLPIHSAWAQDNWIDGNGNWSVPGNWSAGVPGSGANVNISDSDGVSRTVTYNYTGPAVSLDSLTVDLTGGSGSATNTLSMSANNLTISGGNAQEIIGNFGSGSFMQTGGTNNTVGLILALVSGSKGTYSLGGTGILSVSSVSLEIVGDQGAGIFTQTGGTNNTGGLDLGIVAPGNGTYNLSGTGILTASVEVIGGGDSNPGTGNFMQIGGTNTVSGTFGLIVGGGGGSSGTYTLSGGTLIASSISVGNSNAGGTSVLNVSGTGSATATGTLEVYNTAGSALNLNGGTINAGALVLNGNLGLFNWTLGTLNLTNSSATIGNTIAADLATSLTLGSGKALQVSGNVTVNAGGLTVSGTGYVTVGQTLYVYNSAGSALNLSGGTINTPVLNLSGTPALLNWTSGTLNLTGSGVELDNSANNWNGFSSLTLNTGMALEVSGLETVGGSGTGSLTVAGGRNTVPFLGVGYNPGASGIVTITNNGTLASNSDEVIGEANTSTGVLNQSSGQNSVSGNLSLGANSGASGTDTLSGGTLAVASNIFVGGSLAGAGGTGVLTVSGSGNINSPAATITVYNTAASGFNVNGGTVNAAALNLMGTYMHTSGTATYGHITGGGQMSVSGGQITLTDDTSGHLSSVTVGGTSTLGFDIGTSASSQITADTATFTATPTIALTLSGFPDAGTVFTLLSATQFNDNGNLGTLPSQAVVIGRDTLTPSLSGGSGAAGAIIVTVGGGPANLTWIGSNNIGFDGGGAWDTQATHNWDNHSNEALTPDVFYAGDHVTFDDTASNFTVDINSGDVIAKSVTFNNSLNAYTVNGLNGIGGTTGVSFTGSNSVTLNSYNSYTGTTTISGGGTVSIYGSVASPTINVTHGTLQLATDNALTGTPVVTLGNGTTTGVLDLDGTNTNAVGGLSGGGGNLVTNANAAPATLILANGTSTFGGTIQDGNSGGPVALNIGSGSLTLSGTNTYSGGTIVNGGTLAVNGSILGDVAVNYGGTLAGHGTVGGMVRVSNGGFLSPGSGPTSTGTISLGSLTLYSGSQTNIKLAGTIGGTQYDQIQVTGSATLAGTLAVSLING